MDTPPTPIEAFLATLRDLPADQPTACNGWTAHEVAAHLAAGIEEIAELIEDALEEAPARPTRGFDEREAPYRAMPDPDVRVALTKILDRALAALDAQAERGIDVEFFERRWSAEEFGVHAANEFAMHRWDMIGDDPLGDLFMSPPHATESAVKTLNTLKVLEEAPTPRAERGDLAGTRIVLRCPGRADIAFDSVASGRSALEISSSEPLEGDVVVETDPVNRLLTLWGRRSANRVVTVTGDPALWPAVAATLWEDGPAWAPSV